MYLLSYRRKKRIKKEKKD